GPLGCGKTTLISVIGGLLDATEGTVLVLGDDLTAMGGRAKTAFRRTNVGFVFQQYNLLPALTAAENAAVPLIIAGWPRAKAVNRANEGLDAVGLADKRRSDPGQPRGGPQHAA